MASALLSSAYHHLPNELTIIVLEQLSGDNKTLCNLARTSRDLRQLAEEQLYKTIALHSVEDLHAIIEAFSRRNERVRAVQTLKILYRYVSAHLQNSVETRRTFNGFVAQMVHLREWHVESPYDNFKWEKGGHEWVEKDMESFREALEKACVEGPQEEARIMNKQRLGNSLDRTVGLALLQSLTIHSHGAHADFWTLDGFHCLFRHPSLRFLHVSCVTFPQDLPELESHLRKTPLTTLEFDECELKPKSLLRILRTPERLKHLTLGENVFNINTATRLAPRLTKDFNATLEALSAVAHSLETLKHLDPNWRIDHDHRPRRVRPTGEGMRGFHALKTLECDTGSFLHQSIIMNYDLAPPNLETLRIRRHWDVSPDFFDQLPPVETYVALPSLKTVDFLQSLYLRCPLATLDYLCDVESLRNRHAYGYRLYKNGINLKVTVEMHKNISLIPPYLHGEQVPINQCLYDAELIGFHRHINDNIDTVANADIPLHDLVGDSAVRELFPYAYVSRPDPSETQASDIRVDSTDKNRPGKHEQGVTPETDQLGIADILRLNGQMSRTMQGLRRKFIRMTGRGLDFSQNLGDAPFVLGLDLDNVDDDMGSDDSDGLDQLFLIANDHDTEWETASEGEDDDAEDNGDEGEEDEDFVDTGLDVETDDEYGGVD